MNKKTVYTCETCSALYVCLKYFQEHRKKHAIQEGSIVYPCDHCQQMFNSDSESRLHLVCHKGEPPHSCEVCQEIVGISEEEVVGSRRSIGTVTDFHVYTISLDKPMITTGDIKHDLGENGASGVEVDEEESGEEDDDSGDDDDDSAEEDDEEEEDDEGVDDEDEEDQKPNVTNIIYVTNQTINHTTTSQKSYLKPPRASRSTGKGKGNRKARITSDGDVRRKFSCCHCGKSFKTKSHLQRHILTHTGEKPYHCNRCTCRFNQSSSLRNHVIAIHTKEYPHTCNNCSKGFLMPAVLQKHLQTSECGKISNQVVEGL